MSDPEYKPTKSKRRCAFCTSRSCYDRVVTRDMAFDELSCRRHVNALYKLSDNLLPGVVKLFVSSTGYLERGVNPKNDFDDLENQKQSPRRWRNTGKGDVNEKVFCNR